VETREEANFVGLYLLERYTWKLVGGAHHAMVCGIELELDKVADFGLSYIGDESMAALCFLVSIIAAAMDDDVRSMSL
jgi:L-arabinose isomerase